MRVRFTAPVNPLSTSGAGLVKPDGTRVGTVVWVSADGLEWLLVPDAATPGLEVVIDGVESATGVGLPRMRRAPVIFPAASNEK